MEQTPSASFSLLSVRFPRFSFSSDLGADDQAKYELGFVVQGAYNPESAEAIVYMVVKVGQQPEAEPEAEAEDLTEVHCTAVFQLEQGTLIETIPEHFYNNALGILFPYIRSFISNLTVQAGWPTMMLPLLNVTSLNQSLKASILEQK